MPRYISFANFSIILIVILMPFLSLVVLLITYSIVQLINRSDFLGFLLLGRVYKKSSGT